MNNAYKWVRSAARSGKRPALAPKSKPLKSWLLRQPLWCQPVNQRWLGGMLTNWSTMRARIERPDLERMESPARCTPQERSIRSAP